MLTVTDAAFDPFGLLPADWDLLTRVPNLERLDVVVTDTMLAGALHERMHQVLPGIEEVRVRSAVALHALPVLLTTPATSGSSAHAIARKRSPASRVASSPRFAAASSRRRAAPRSSSGVRCRTSTSRAR